MPYISELDHKEVKEAAKEKLRKEDFKKAVEEKKQQMKTARLHLLPKRIAFQWPVRLEDWLPLNKTK